METFEERLNRLNQGDFWANFDEDIKNRNAQRQAELERQNSFEYRHPILSGTLDVVKSIPEAGVQFATRAVKSYPEISAGANDFLYLLGDIIKNENLSNFGKNNSDFWKETADNIKTDPQYEGIQGLTSPKTFLPTALGELGGQASNIITTLAGGSAGAKLAGTLALAGAKKAGLITAGTILPNLAQEGQYGDKIEAFYAINGRMPNEEELRKIQTGTVIEKGVNTAGETVADRLFLNKAFPLLNKALPKSVPNKGIANRITNIAKSAGEQTVAEGLTEGFQEGVSIGTETALGLNRGDNAQRMKEAVIMGGLVGGIIGGGATALSDYSNQQAFQKAQEQAQQQAQQQEIQNVKEYVNEVEKNGGNGASAIADEIINKTFYAPTVQEQGGMLINLQQNTSISPYNMNTQLVPTQEQQNNITPQLTAQTIPLLQKKQTNKKEEPVTSSTTVDSDIQSRGHDLVNGSKNNINDNNSNVNYSDEVKEKLNELNKEYEQYRNILKNDNVIDPTDKANRLKGLAMEYSARKREIIQGESLEPVEGGLTKKELEKKKKRLNSNYIGKKVFVDGKKATIVKNVFGKHKVMFEDGTTKTVTSEEIKTAENTSKEVSKTQKTIEKIAPNTAKKQGLVDKNSKVKNKNLIMTYKNDTDPINENENFYTDFNYIVKKDYFKLAGQGKTRKATPELDNDINELYKTFDEKYTYNKATVTDNVTYKNATKPIAVTLEYTNNKGEQKKTFLSSEYYKEQFKGYSFEVSNETHNGKPIIKITDNGETVGYVASIVPDENKIKQTNEAVSSAKSYNDNIKVEEEVKNARREETDGGRNQTGDNRSVGKRAGNVQVSGSMVREQPEGANRNSKEHVGRNGNARSADNVNVGIRKGIITDEHKTLTEKSYKNQHELNKAIENFIKNKEYEKYDELPEEVKSWLKNYSGAGGLEKQGAEGKGLLSEYYTPQNVVKKMWDITSQYIETDGAKVLEPSVGIGRFLEFAPENTNFDVVEMNPISAKITELLYPNANVTVGEFQERFINKETNSPRKKVTPEYDIVIGNPPYGMYTGRYKGLGEGKNIGRIEQYFIKRGLDTLKENGVMTFIVPSSFLNGSISTVKQEISSQAELIDAYRLPENTFSTTSIGTDIIVLRKNNNAKNGSILNAGNWFKQHPDKVLGSVDQRKNRFGKEETYVKGDKNLIENIDTSKKDIKQTVENSTTVEKKVSTEKTRKTKQTKNEPVLKGNVEYTRYVPKNTVSPSELKYFADTRVDGTLPKNKYSPNEKVNMFNGDLYNDLNYLQGDIYEKLDALETENITEKQKEIQRKKLMSVLPKRKGLEQIKLTPTSDFVREYQITGTRYDRYQGKEIEENTTLDIKYLDYVSDLTSSERDSVPVSDIRTYVQGGRLTVKYKGYNATAEEKNNQKTEYLTRLKTITDKTFNDFLNNELSIDEVEKLTEKWNRTFNNLYTPDYKKVPLLVEDLNSTFKGKVLKLQDVQVEGINFLTNKGVGLLGFEVGVGKTLSGIISTVQNMQMGRCKRPLIIVPKQVKPNWIYEINQAFPNVKINDLDNLSKFKGTIEDGTISVATYQALDNIWYSEDTAKDLISSIDEIKTDFNRDSSKRGREQVKERNEEFFGSAEKGNKKLHTFEDLGFDHITVDEAHNFKNLFPSINADGRNGNIYTNISGASSTRAKRMFLATQYILSNNDNRNVFMLTATPFNNSPLEVFNMLSYLAKDKLDKMGLYNVFQFMENYIDLTADWVVNSKNQVTFSQIPKSFKNLQSLQEVIDTCMLIRSAEDSGVKRPEKHTFKVTLDPTQEQLDLIAQAETEAVSNRKDKGAILKALSKARSVTLSPAIYNNDLEISPEEFIESSPKLKFVANAIEEMIKKQPKTGQLLYMPLGVDFLPKIKQYFVNKKVFKPEEIAIIKSGVDDDKIAEITSSFNNKDGTIKLIIGTSKMREGMNLNGNTSVLYIPYLDWNPTDYVQVVGRIWRQGNSYDDIRVVVPLLKNSADSFIFQKHDEKTSRINNIMDRGKDYIDTAELNTAEEKLNMITNPDKKAIMFSQIKEQEINSKRAGLEAKLSTVQYYRRELKDIEFNINRYEELRKKYETQLEYMGNKDGWKYENIKSYLEGIKKDLAKAKQSFKYINARVENLELDLNIEADSRIQEEINKLDEEKEHLKEIVEIEKAKYKDEYEKNKKEGKGIPEYIKDFNKQTDELYKGIEFLRGDIDIPYFLQKYNNENDFAFFLKGKSLKSGEKLTTIRELENHPAYAKIKDFFEGYEDIEICYAEVEILNAYPNVKAYKRYNKIYVTKDFKPEYIVHELTHIKDSNVNKSDVIYILENLFYSITNIKTTSKILNKIQQAIYENSLKEKLAFENQEIAKKRIEKNEIYEFKSIPRRTLALYQKVGTFKNSIINSVIGIRTNRANRKTTESTKGSYHTGNGKSTSRNDFLIEFLQETKELNNHIPDDIDEILPKVKPPKDNTAEKIITPISTRLDEINPTLKHAIRKFEFESGITENRYANTISPFIRKLDYMTPSDYAKYDLALKNGNKEVISSLNAKYDLSKEYTGIKNLLEEIRNEAVGYGLDVGYIEDYFPRKVINPSAILEEYSKSSYLKNMLREIDPNNTLSDEDKLEKINIALKGHNGAINENSSFVKARKITEITKDLNRYYKDSRKALVDYITSMNNAIETRKFFGKGDNLDESIGAYTRDLLDRNLITPANEVKLKQILKARFKQRGVTGFWRDFKNIGYISTIGSPFSAITQIGDFAFTLYRNGIFNTITGLKKALSDKKITKEDLGIHKIAQEFQKDGKTGKLVDNVFKIVGLNKIDSLGKETFINGAFERLKQEATEAIKNPKNAKTAKFYNNLRNIFGDESYEVLQDLSNGNITENVKYLLFSEISDFQPISLAEMPEVYLTSGNGRIAYMLKTYGLKLIDVYRNEIFRQFKTDKKTAIQNLIRLTLYVSLLGVGADGLKDLLMGRKFDFGVTFLDNILKLAMFSEYKLAESKKEGIAKSLLEIALPPTNIFDDLYKDVLDEKLYTGEKSLNKIRSIRNLPVIGKFYYWFGGAGLDVKARENKTDLKNKLYKVYSGEHGRKEYDKIIQKLKKDGFTKEEIKNINQQSITSYLSPYKKRYKRALEKGDKKAIQQLREELKRTNISEVRIKKAMNNTYEEYLKEKHRKRVKR